jgi:hypothetical protein
MDPPLSLSMQQALFKSRTPGLKRKSSHTFLAFKHCCKTKIQEIVILEWFLKSGGTCASKGVNLLTLPWMAADLLRFVDFCWFFVPWAHLPRSTRVVKVLKFVELFLPQDSMGTTKRSISTCMEMHQERPIHEHTWRNATESLQQSSVWNWYEAPG